MHHPSSPKTLLANVLLGDERTAVWSKPQLRSLRRGARAPGSLAADEEGMLSFATVFVVLGFVVLLTFVGEVGHVTTEKLEVQNAADAAAYSTSLWQARGMNAVTTTNHVMGELTALMVIVESFGGPELDGESIATEESKKQNRFIMNGIGGLLGNLGLPNEVASTLNGVLLHPVGSVAWGSRVYQLDEKFVGFVQSLMAKDSAGEHDAGAAIYDAQLTMKYWVGFGFCLKGLVNAGYAAVTVLGLGFSEPAASTLNIGCHIVIDGAVAWVCKDWVLVKGLEILALGLQPFKDAAPYMLMALSLYGDSVAKKGRLTEPISQTLAMLEQRHGVDQLQVFPAPEELALPVIIEAPPDKDVDSGELSVPPTLWTKNEWEKSTFVKIMNWPMNQMDNMIATVNSILSPLTSLWGDKEPIPTLGKLMDRLQPTFWPMDPVKLDEAGLGTKPGGWGYPENPSLESLPKLDWETERYSQWVRATYPYVDSFRAPFLKLFEDTMGPSNLWTYYTNWTNRYTLVVANQIRTGEAFGMDQTNQSLAPCVRRLLAEYSKRVRDLRRKYDQHVAPSAIFVDIDTPEDPYKQISLELNQLASDLRTDLATCQVPEQVAAGMTEWIQKVLQHQDFIQRAKQAAGSLFESSFLIDRSDFEAVSEDVARVETLGLLIRLLEEIFSNFEQIAQLAEISPPHMWVMEGSTPETKGREAWTRDDLYAEDLFSVIATSQKNSPSMWGGNSDLYAQRSEKLAAFAQSICYNANGNRVNGGGSQEKQPDTGWDTLNWEPEVQALEWGGASPAIRSNVINLFRGRLSAKSGSRAKINWQAKLVPISGSKVTSASRDKGQSGYKVFEDIQEHATQIRH